MYFLNSTSARLSPVIPLAAAVLLVAIVALTLHVRPGTVMAQTPDPDGWCEDGFQLEDGFRLDAELQDEDVLLSWNCNPRQMRALGWVGHRRV